MGNLSRFLAHNWEKNLKKNENIAKYIGQVMNENAPICQHF